MDQGVQQPLAGGGGSVGDCEPNLLGQVGELSAGGRLDVDGIQGRAKLV
jgi:hypothetical protein